MSHLCLNMVVRNESVNLPRCLRAIAPHIHSYAIADTGSTDGTPQLIRNFFAEHKTPGAVLEVPNEEVTIEINGTRYFNFEEGRNRALRFARSLHGELNWDYVLFCDADMELAFQHKHGKFPPLDAPAYALLQDNGQIRYWNVRLLRHDETCEYKNVTHEAIVPSATPITLNEVWYKDHETGANRERKYVRDAELLTWGLKQEPENSRYVFYLAQTLINLADTVKDDDAKQHRLLEQSRDFYLMRSQMGGWEEEVWMSGFQLAHLYARLEEEPGIVTRSYLMSHQTRPHRAEPLFYLAKYLSRREEYHLAMIFARTAALMQRPNDVLPVDHRVYEWAAMDEWMCCAQTTGNLADAKIAAKQLIGRRVPPDEYARVQENIRIVLGHRAKQISDERMKQRKKKR